MSLAVTNAPRLSPNALAYEREQIGSRKHLEECLIAVEQVLESRFPYMAGRGQRVARLSKAIAARLGRGTIDDYVLYLASRFHDLGMLAIPDGVLLKRDKLAPAELTAIRQHPALGARLVSKFFPDLPAAAGAIIYHHERPDGGGIYGLRGEKIPLTVGVIALAGAVEAMANDRPHRPAMPLERMIEELRQARGVQFAAEVVDAFLPRIADLMPLVVAGVPRPAPAPQAHPHGAITVAQPATPPADHPQPAPVCNQTPLAPRPPAINRDQALKRLEQALANRTHSPVGARVVSLAASSGAEVADLANIIATDPVLASRVLDVANSAAYGANRRLTTSIPDAVRNVGLSTVRNIALALGVIDAVPTKPSAHFNLFRYWQHSLAVARLCEDLAARADPASAGVGYLAGLCHELGAIAFHSVFAEEYRYVLEQHEKTGLPAEDLEREILGTTRAELEAAVLHALRLPDGVHAAVEAVVGARTPASRDGAVAQALACADLMAAGLLLASGPAAAIRPLTKRMLPAPPSGDAQPPLPDKECFASEILSLTATLARLSPDEQADLTRPLFAQREIRVWLARSPEYSPYDPIAAALHAVSQVTVSQRLPPAQELNQIDRLVVLTPGRPNDRIVCVPQAATLLQSHAASAGAAVPTLCLIEPVIAAKGELKPVAGMTIESCVLPLERLVAFVHGAGE